MNLDPKEQLNSIMSQMATRLDGGGCVGITTVNRDIQFPSSS
jgi:hypothetical protein